VNVGLQSGDERSGDVKPRTTLTSIDIVICTHTRASALDAVLGALARLRAPADIRWSVLVVDNASTDDTPQVVEKHRSAGVLSLRYVREETLGLTPARLRGVTETTGEWVAFVDDDNLLDAGWLEAMAGAIGEHPNAGGFGGRVCLQWQMEPPAPLRQFGYCFAEQELGDEPKDVKSLVGAGMVLSRAALEASGWTQGPLLEDRVGKRLVSGGDAEIAARVRGAGFKLRYVPTAVMQHVMPPQRASFRYLLRIAWALGASEASLRLLGWPGEYAGWKRFAAKEQTRRLRQALRGLWWSVRTRRELKSALVWLAAARGFSAGVRQVRALGPERRSAVIGAAHSQHSLED